MAVAMLWGPEKVFVWGALGLTDLIGVTGCETGDFGGGGLEAIKIKQKNVKKKKKYE